LSKDPFVVAANHVVAEWQRKTKEVERKKKQQKLQAREWGEETDSDDDNKEDDEVVADAEWDDLESEDTLTCTHSSMQGHFPFHAGGSELVRPVEMDQTVGPSSGPAGAGGSTTTSEVPLEGSGPATLQGVAGVADLPLCPRCWWRGQLRCRAPRGADRGGWPHRGALRGQGGEPLCPGAGGRLKIASF